VILLTGATGFIGRHVAARLHERGDAVRCVVLPEESLNGLARPGCEVVRGNVTDWESLQAARAPADVVIHAAALLLPNQPERIRRVNVEGTRNVVRLAEECGARRLIYFSAVSATYRTRNVYGDSKAEAEALVAAARVPHTILRPTMVYGRDGGLHFQQLVRLVRRAPGALPILGSGRALLQPVWIEDVVRAVELALDHASAADRVYGVAGGTVVSFDEYVDQVAVALGRRTPRKIHLPLGLCEALGSVGERLVGPNFFSPAALRGINEDATLDVRPFRDDCGYSPVALDAGLRAALGPA
jgi:NADH dehydrogenase